MSKFKFKLGDTVRYVGGGVTGVITECRTSPWSGLHSYLIRHAHDQAQRCIWESELELVPQSQLLPREFKVGDRVEVFGMEINYSRYNGVRGVIIRSAKREDEQNHVATDEDSAWGGHTLYFKSKNLQLLSPQSPQPQTKSPYDVYALGGWKPNKPKEDNMFAVISYNFATGNHAVTTYPTADEAKEKAGMTVAKNRSSLTEKTFFSIAIVDLRTGKLVGSVVDAPPAVEWKTE